MRRVALFFGLVYTAVGVLGFLPFLGGTFGMDSSNLFKLVPTNLPLNLAHLVVGLAGLAAGATETNARVYSQVVGVILILVGLAGIVWSNVAGLVPIGGLDVGIHLTTGAILAYFGFGATEAGRTTP